MGELLGTPQMALRVVSEQSEANIRKQRVHDQLTRDLRRFAANFLRMTSGSGKPLDLLPQMERLAATIRAYADAHDGALPKCAVMAGVSRRTFHNIRSTNGWCQSAPAQIGCCLPLTAIDTTRRMRATNSKILKGPQRARAGCRALPVRPV
jgi:hypothetical protein